MSAVEGQEDAECRKIHGRGGKRTQILGTACSTSRLTPQRPYPACRFNGGYPTESGHTSWDRGVITGSPPLCAESRGPAAERASYWRCETTSWHYGRRCPQPSARLTPAGPHRRCTRRLTRGEITARGRGWWRCPWPGTAPRLAPAGSRNSASAGRAMRLLVPNRWIISTILGYTVRPNKARPAWRGTAAGDMIPHWLEAASTSAARRHACSMSR
jgi:hypothetical protein